VGHIEITGQYNWLLFIQPSQIISQGFIPCGTVGKPLKLHSRIGNITINQVEGRKFSGNGPALFIMLFNTDSVGHRHQFLLGEDRSSRISLFHLAAGPIGMRIFGAQHHRDGIIIDLGFLEAHNISIFSFHISHALFILG